MTGHTTGRDPRAPRPSSPPPGEPDAGRRRRVLLGLEFLLLFVAAPLAVRYRLVPVHPFLLLWLAAGLALVVLLNDPSYRRGELWDVRSLRRRWPVIVVRFAAAAVALGLLVAWLTPARLFVFVRERPGLWALVMVLYPALSVCPQGIVYRAFLLHRYRSLVPSPLGRIALSAVAFGLMHVVLGNPVAVTLTLMGGGLFAATHLSSRSLPVSVFEHTLYGWLVFTVGWGWYFYLGSAPR